MISAVVSFIGTGFLSLFGLVLALLPSVSVEDLPVLVPEGVSQALGFLNVFIPFADLVSIVTWWAALVLALNVFYIAYSVINRISK